ncbi:hypothetical protein BH10ACT1_BH10ACT1_05170 [soil metagenome]
MFNVGGPEIVVILIIALLVLGPDQLPKAMRTMGNAMAQVNKVKGGLQAEINKAMNAVDAATKAEPEPKAEAPAPAADVGTDRASERASS